MTKQHDVDIKHKQDAQPGISAVDISFAPIIGRAYAKLFHHELVSRCIGVEKSTTEQHTPYAILLWAMWVSRLIALLVVTAVYCYPFTSDHASSKPQPKPHEMIHSRME